MLVASVLDPDLFSPENWECPALKELLVQRLDAIITHHVLVLDGQDMNSSSIMKELGAIYRQLSAQLPPELQTEFRIKVRQTLRARLGLLIESRRKGYIEMKDACLNRQTRMEKTAASKGSAASVALAEHPHVNVVLLSDKTHNAAISAGCDSSKMATTVTYTNTPAYDFESGLGKTKNVESWSRQQFLDEIITPVVCLARYPRLFDKHLCTSMMEKQGNRDQFKATVAAIHEAWRKGPSCEHGRMEIISSSVRGLKNFDAQAREVADFLALNDDHVSIYLKPSWGGLGKQQHDRFLKTDHGVCLWGLSGFDVLSGESCTLARFSIGDNDSAESMLGKDIACYTYKEKYAPPSEGQRFAANPFGSLQLKN